jgi:hypothetical protein
LSFYQRQKKFGVFVFCKIKLTWKRAKVIKKDKKEGKVEEWLHETTHGASLSTKRSSMGLFSILNVCGLEIS